jgi:hypothetical protein
MYVDDSGSLSLTGGNYYFLSGVIVHEQHLDTINELVKGFKDTYFVDELYGTELHVYDIFNRCKQFAGIDLSTRDMILQKVYELITTLPITIVCSGIVKNKLRMYDNLLRYVWTFLVERFDKHISNSRAVIFEKGLILSDKGSYENKIVKIVSELIRHGSQFQQISNLIEIPIFATSYDHQLIQIADACAYCTMKYHTANRSIFQNYWHIIYNKFRKDPNGDTQGYGLKIFP